jgi:hypothetical protein
VSPVNDSFDPKYHDAVSTVERPELPNNTVMQVLRPGYVLRGKVLRPAMVAVNKLPGIETPVPLTKFPTPPRAPSDRRLDDTVPEQDAEPDHISDSNSSPLDRAWRILESRDE